MIHNVKKQEDVLHNGKVTAYLVLENPVSAISPDNQTKPITLHLRRLREIFY